MLSQFKDYLTVEGYAEKSIISYSQEIKRFFDNHKKFNKNNVFEYIKYLRNNTATNTVNQFIKAGKVFSKFQKINIHFPKLKSVESKIPDYLSENDFLDILEKIQILTEHYVKWKAILSLMFYCGLRKQEVINLIRTDFDLEKNFVKIYKTKTKTARILPFPKEVGNLIKQCFLIEPEKHNAFNVSNTNIDYIFKSIKTGFGLEKFYPHILRHSCTRYLLKSGVPINEVQVITGHKNLESLQIYAKCKNEEINDLYTKKVKPKINKRQYRK
jgi:integrase/recombinase XerD